MRKILSSFLVSLFVLGLVVAPTLHRHHVHHDHEDEAPHSAPRASHHDAAHCTICQAAAMAMAAAVPYPELAPEFIPVLDLPVRYTHPFPAKIFLYNAPSRGPPASV